MRWLLYVSKPRFEAMVPEAGLEPALPCDKRFLRPPRLPFRHSGF